MRLLLEVDGTVVSSHGDDSTCIKMVAVEGLEPPTLRI